MQSKLKIFKTTNKIKAVVKYLIIAFFFSSFFIFLFTLAFGSKFEGYLSILNSMSININEKAEKTSEFNLKSNKPSWGDEFGTISIPSISLTLPVVHGDSMDLIVNRVGHYAGSYFPGEGGSVILPGHNSKNIFHELPKLNIGDEIIIETTYGTYTYEIYKTLIIENNDDDKLPVQSDMEILMLYTCYPVDAIWYAKYRYVVYAIKVGDTNE